LEVIVGRKSKMKRSFEYIAKVERKSANRDEESRLIQAKRATMEDPFATNVSFRRLTPEEIEQEKAAQRATAIKERKHFGDPCEFCNLSFDDVNAGPCEGITP